MILYVKKIKDTCNSSKTRRLYKFLVSAVKMKGNISKYVNFTNSRIIYLRLYGYRSIILGV